MASNDEFKIGTPDDVENWLRGKPHEWGQTIALRAALRVAPLAFTIFDPEEEASYDLGKRVALSIFRALFVTWSYLRHAGSPSDDLQTFAGALEAGRSNAVQAVMMAADEADDVAPYGYSLAGMAAHAARDATMAAHPSVLNSESAFQALYGAAGTAKSAVEIFHVPGATPAVAESDIRRAIAADAKWQSEHPRKRLIEQPLWLIDVRGDAKFKVNFPRWIRNPFDDFANSRLAKETPWGIWVAWYRALLPVQPDAMRRLIHGPQTDLILLSQDENFWERDPDTVMSDVSVLLETGKLPARPDVKRTPPVTERGEPPPAEEIQLHFLSDSVDPSVDYLNRAETAFILAMRLNLIWDDMRTQEGHADGAVPVPSPGFVVHIDSPWGGGKSTFMSYVTRILNPWRYAGTIPSWAKKVLLHSPRNWPEEYRRPWVIVNFNAWRHQHVSPRVS